MLFRHRTGEFDLARHTLIVGILNVTPDSFSDGGEFLQPDSAVARAADLVKQGADVLDIGGESTRPGAAPVAADEEIRRILPVIQRCREQLGVPISVDTYKASVAKAAIAAGASIVNDISAFRFDADLLQVVQESGAGIILMHLQGTPATMQRKPHYQDVVSEVKQFLSERMQVAFAHGIDSTRVMIDPGIGFGKSGEHNLQLLRRLEELKSLGQPILVGTSRKSFIAQTVGGAIEDRDWGTAATVACCIAKGAHAVRVHNVELCSQVARMTDAVIRPD
jgi:dihydropteroate synthase